MKINVRSPVSNDSLTFEYPGISYNRYVSSMDSQYVSVLGTDQDGHPNFVRFDYKGGGALYLQFAPTAFSNFFLIHKNNKAYYDNVFSYLPSSIKEIKWDDYFRYPRHDGFSAFQYILSIRSFRWAFWLLLLLFLILYIFESQRKQRMIPKVASINNTSLDFVKTVGRLYFQRKDHYNLANKMAAHFLLKVRSRYNLSTSELNDVFAEKLAYKSGYDKNLTKEIVDNILYVQLNRELSDHNLMQLNQRLEAFYKNT